MPLGVSVIICTYNRCDSLRQTLESLRHVAVPTGLTWELLVMDNNSTDSTRAVCEKNTDLPLRYLFEPKQGKSYALNHAVREARASLLLFTDDDVDVEQNWLQSLSMAAQAHSQAGFFGGKIIPRWERNPPRWLAQHQTTLLDCVSVSFDKGEVERFITEGEGYFMGANLAIRKESLPGASPFPTDIGPTKHAPTRGEETELIEKMMGAGFRGLYVPQAIIYHRNGPERMTERYVRLWYKGRGMVEVRRAPPVTTNVTFWFGAPRYLWRKLIQSAAKYLCTRFTTSSGIWLLAEIDTATTWGKILEFRSRARPRTAARHLSRV